MHLLCTGARLAFGGKPLEGHSIPKQYGAITPTAVFVPLEEILKDANFELVTTEVFGPVQASLSIHPQLARLCTSLIFIVQTVSHGSSFFRSRLQCIACTYCQFGGLVHGQSSTATGWLNFWVR